MYRKTKLTAYGSQRTEKKLRTSNTVRGERLAVSAAKRQEGWLMPVAAFIVVAMGILALSLLRVTSSTSISGAQEMISVQTFFAAESGAQYAMNRLFYNTATPIVPATADASCAAITGNVLNFSAPGMNGCQTTLGCSVVVDAGSGTSFYQISSVAQCQVGNVSAQRTVDVSAYLQ